MYYRMKYYYDLVILLHCAVESKPTPGDVHGNYSPSRSVSIASSRRFVISLEKYFVILSSQVQRGLPHPR